MDALELNTSPRVGYDEDEYVPPHITQFIVVKFGEEQYGIDIKYVDNIIRMQRITRVPEVPAYIRGVINVRGEVLPVMSVRLKMDMEEDVETKSTRIIILKLEHHGNIGIVVDEVKEVVNLEDNQIEKTFNGTREDRPNFIYGIGKYEGGLISLLNLNAVALEKDTI